jgi:hypothetical protein
LSFFKKVTNGLWEGYQLLNTANYTACLFISLKSDYKHSCPINYTMYCEHCTLVIALMPEQGDQKSWSLNFYVTLLCGFHSLGNDCPEFSQTTSSALFPLFFGIADLWVGHIFTINLSVLYWVKCKHEEIPTNTEVPIGLHKQMTFIINFSGFSST